MEFMRQQEVFNPSLIRNVRIDVVGAGAIGSGLCWQLAKVGATKIRVWDHDIVEDHNLPNQMFMLEHVGIPKVEAVKDMVYRGSGVEIESRFEKVEGPNTFGEVVFLAIDSMDGNSGRRGIYESSLKMSVSTKLVIETRMGAMIGRVYAFNPNSLSECSAWEKTLCSDDEAETSACGAVISIAPTAALVVSYATWQLMRWLKGSSVENELLLSASPPLIVSSKF
jgi:molybdopterin/thiamine biosynthesis adenylyltransferase